MWLLNTTTMKLKFFLDPSTSKYAILSHTWGDEEVTFQEWQQIEAGTKEGAILKEEKYLGYFKIKMTCQMARHAGLEYAWIDTCCIDKSSSSELSEAINSMFKWYEASKTCFAYLSDYTCPAYLNVSLAIRAGQLRASDLKLSRWLKRGWTLQELIASKEVIFFDSNWNQFGQKWELVEMLSEITKITCGVLTRQQGLHEVSVAQRMSWAAHRETTRIEDGAYCLLGIFDINMPLLYGEGNKAFLRLQDEILRRSKDLSLFAWADDFSPRASALFGTLSREGLFASSPMKFAKCTKMRSLAQTPRKRKDYALTQNGLEIDAVFDPTGGGSYYVELDTWDGTEGREGWVSMELTKTGNIYLRMPYRPLQRSPKSRLVRSLSHAKILPVCIETTREGYNAPTSAAQVSELINITCETSLLGLITKGGWYGQVVDLPSRVFVDAETFDFAQVIVEHFRAGDWLAILSFTFESSGAVKPTNMAIVCGQNRYTRPWLSIPAWVGLFGQPVEHFNLADSALTTVAGLSHNSNLKESEVMEAVEDILFSQFSNDLGQVVDSSLPKEFLIPDGNLAQNRSGYKIFLEIQQSPNLKINIRCETISLTSNGETKKRKRE